MIKRIPGGGRGGGGEGGCPWLEMQKIGDNKGQINGVENHLSGNSNAHIHETHFKACR